MELHRNCSFAGSVIFRHQGQLLFGISTRARGRVGAAPRAVDMTDSGVPVALARSTSDALA